MKRAYTVDEALGSEADASGEVFDRCISEIDRHLQEMQDEQEAIRRTGERTELTLTEIHGILARLKAA